MAILVGPNTNVWQSVKKFLIHRQNPRYRNGKLYLLKQTAQGRFIITTKSYGMTVENQNTRNIH